MNSQTKELFEKIGALTIDSDELDGLLAEVQEHMANLQDDVDRLTESNEKLQLDRDQQELMWMVTRGRPQFSLDAVKAEAAKEAITAAADEYLYEIKLDLLKFAETYPREKYGHNG